VSRWSKRIAAGIALIAVAIGLLLASAGFLDRDAHHLFAASGRRAGVSALYFSGDMGLRFGMGPPTAQALAANGIPVLGVNSSTLFRAHKTRAETAAIVAQAVTDALRVAGRDQLVLIGQSYGADVLQTGLVDLPPALRRHVRAVVLVVPGRDVFFRADPTDFAYRGAPDSDGSRTIRALRWAPLTCIYGTREPDSACPAAQGSGATVIAMPGGHFLNRDSAALIGHVLAAVARTSPSLHLRIP
jgi:type IV secretory pathway VirJ component